jgi:uncharacterized membrane protein
MSFLKNIARRFSLSRRGYVILGTLVSALTLIGLITLLLLYGTDEPGRGERFLGRLHPVVVHLPIGILLAVLLYEITTLVFPEFRNLPVLLFLIWIGFLTAAASVLAGFFLSLSGGYDASYLFWHKWLGVLVAVCSGACFLFAGLEYLNPGHWKTAQTYRKLYRATLFCMALFLSITGHLGGTLTHGPGYVTEYLPAYVKAPLGLEEATTASSSGKIQNIEKAKIYADLVRPVLQKRCVSCHGPSKTKGDLRLDTKKHIKKGGENGKIIQPGKPEKSELVRRITLPLYDEGVMPPDNKKPLSIGNTELIRWWVATGASFKKTVGEVDAKTIPSSVKTKFDRITAKPEPERLAVFDTDVPATDKKQVNTLRASTDWKFSYLSDDARFLEVRYAADGKQKLTKTDLQQLKPVRKQVVWLDVSGRKLTDRAWAYLQKFPLLNRLHAERTNIQDRHLKHLSSHKYLVYLNVHHTQISGSGLEHLTLDKLQKLFVWQTEISDNKIKKLRQKYPQLTIEEGITDLDGGPITGTKNNTGIVKKMESEAGTFKINTNGIDNGTPTYSDRDYTFSEVPDELRGHMYIRTPNEFRKKKGGDVPEKLLTLDLSSPATVYLAYDTRTKSRPEWLTKNFEKTEMYMGLTQYPDFQFRLYKRDVPAGKVTFGPNAADDYDPSNNSITMFSVVLAAKSQ